MGRLQLLKRSIQKRGVIDTLRIVFSELMFDRMHGTDTSQGRNISEMYEVNSASKEEAEDYQPTSYVITRRCFAKLSKLRGKEAGGTLIDYGSGKGRVLIAALKNNFDMAVGVEFSNELVKTANENLRKLEMPSDKYKVLCMDAMLFSPDATLPSPITHFFFNPFSDVILEKVFENIIEGENTGENDLICYVNPVHAYLLELKGCTLVSDRSEVDFKIYSLPKKTTDGKAE